MCSTRMSESFPEKVIFLPEGAQITLPGFSLADTLNCGQCFRWEETAPDSFRGIASGKSLDICQNGDVILMKGVTESDYPFWRLYFDFDTDYEEMKQRFQADETLKKACRAAGGIRLLRQDPWEALCSFIISQNNNIPRIKGIVSRLCEQFGKAVPGGFSFPSAEKLAPLSVEDLAPLRAGFRAKYILDAAAKVSSGKLNLNSLAGMPMDEARAALQTICGVGPKVAECALLYGCHRLEAFPIDTWIRKALAKYYPGGFPDFAEPKGAAQQFLFHYIRTYDSV